MRDLARAYDSELSSSPLAVAHAGTRTRTTQRERVSARKGWCMLERTSVACTHT